MIERDTPPTSLWIGADIGSDIVSRVYMYDTLLVRYVRNPIISSIDLPPIPSCIVPSESPLGSFLPRSRVIELILTGAGVNSVHLV